MYCTVNFAYGLSLQLRTSVTSAPLTVRPSFLLVDEDWELSRTLPVSICPAGAQIIAGDPTHFFSVVKLNATCSTLRLNKELDADVSFAE
ncbi:hypothetical protein Y032_0641g1020 [Ancylostoma ceylanicum]|uniref:Uncharacterized protein n=1 Tax=Ancylostoma ceylanicum TaxID=53326 RepID=A0A016WIU9_9BILA|nr:hypothetical protein Y032_0641g1020 [Ancylostoma ceylanicum]